MSLGTYLRWMVRESRGARGRMLYFTVCLAIGVAAVVGTAALAAGIQRGFDEQSRDILGADFSVDARRALPPELDAALAEVAGLERSDTLETMTMVSTGTDAPRSRLAQLFVLRGRYPLYGAVQTSPAGGLDALLGPDTVAAEADLLSALGIAVGDELRVGTRTLRVAAVASGGPQAMGFSAFLAPRLYMTREAFDAAGLLAKGSRVRFRVLCALPGEPSREEIEALMARVEAAVPDAPYLDFDAHHQLGRSRRWVERMEGFVGLVALLSLVIGGIGVALIVRTWLAERTRATAVMRCLGVTPRQILALSLAHVAGLALVGSLVGAAIGCALPHLVRAWAPDLLPVELVAVVPVGAILRGVGLGVGLALLFALPALTAIWRVAPARVLRADAEPLPAPRGVAVAAGVLLVAGVFLSAWVQAERTIHAVWFTGGFVALALLLHLAARALIALARRVPRRRLPPLLVHGVTALTRPGAGTKAGIVALGLGTMVVTAVALVETRLQDALVAGVPQTAPSVFLVDIQPEQREGVAQALAAAGATHVDEVPVVMGRIASIDGRPIAELAAERGNWSLTREQRLTWRRALTEDNTIVAGALWSDPAQAEISVEERFARRIGVDVGSTITFDIQGVPVPLRVTSIRAVEWQSLSLNFFLVAEPGALEGAPALYLASAQVPSAAEAPLQDRLGASFGNVTVLRVRAVLDEVLGLLDRIAWGLRILGALTVLAGLAMLAGAVSASVLHRAREVALLKTLGVTRRGVATLLFTEYALGGAVAGLIGAGGAMLLAWAWLDLVAEIDVSLPWVVVPLAMLAIALLSAACGVLANVRALRVRPVAVLR